MSKKAIATGRWWICENLDLLAPITDEGVAILYNDGGQEFLPSLPPNLEWASETEKKAYANTLGQVFNGDMVDIVKGKLKGEKKEVNGFFTYIVKGTYGHGDVDYLTFTDGTKTNILNCAIKGKKVYAYKEKPEFFVGGRL